MSSHTPYDPSQHLEPAREMARRGATRVELADFFGVSIASVDLWAACHADFADALRVGRELADDRVERALYERCVGYTFDSEKVQYAAGGPDVPGEWVRTPIREHAPPDTGAAFKWLERRRSAEWAAPEDGSGGNVTVTILRAEAKTGDSE